MQKRIPKTGAFLSISLKMEKCLHSGEIIVANRGKLQYNVDKIKKYALLGMEVL